MMTLPKLFVLGDSISMEYGPFLEQMVAGKWQYARKRGEAGQTVNLDDPEGANGGDSRRCLDFLTKSAAHKTLVADVLLLNCGLHDIKLQRKAPDRGVQVPPEEYRANLHKLIAAAKQIGATLVWVRTTPVNEEQHNTAVNSIHRRMNDVQRYNEIADDVMASHQTPVIDLFGFTMDLGPTHETLRDGRHFHPPISRLQAANITGWLENWRANRT